MNIMTFYFISFVFKNQKEFIKLLTHTYKKILYKIIIILSIVKFSQRSTKEMASLQLNTDNLKERYKQFQKDAYSWVASIHFYFYQGNKLLETCKGSGFLIEKNKLLSAYHNIFSENYGIIAKYCMVQFRNQKQQKIKIRSKISQEWFYNEKYDLAFIQLQEDYQEFNKNIEFATYDNQYIKLIQHAQEDLFVYGFSSKIFTQEYTQHIHILQAKFLRFENEDWILYKAGTEKGMSGGPLVFSSTETKIIICGLHVSKLLSQNECKSLCFNKQIVQQIQHWKQLQNKKLFNQSELKTFITIIIQQKQMLKHNIELISNQIMDFQKKIFEFISTSKNKQISTMENSLINTKSIQQNNNYAANLRNKLQIQGQSKENVPSLEHSQKIFTFSKISQEISYNSEDSSDNANFSYDYLLSDNFLQDDTQEQQEQFNHKIVCIKFDKDYGNIINEKYIKHILFTNHFCMIEYLQNQNLNYLAHLSIHTCQNFKKFSIAHKEGEDMFNQHQNIESFWKEGRKSIYCWILSNISIINELQALNIYNTSLETISYIKLNQIYQIYEFDLAFKLKSSSQQDKKMFQITKKLVRSWLKLQRRKDMKYEEQTKLNSLDLIVNEILLKHYKHETIQKIRRQKQKYHNNTSNLRSKDIVQKILQTLNDNLHEVYLRHFQFRIKQLFKEELLKKYATTISYKEYNQIKSLMDELLQSRITLKAFQVHINQLYSQKPLVYVQDNHLLTESCRYSLIQAFQMYDKQQELAIYKEKIFNNDLNIQKYQPIISNLLIENVSLFMNYFTTKKPEYFSRFYFQEHHTYKVPNPDRIDKLLIVTRNDSLQVTNDLIKHQLSQYNQQTIGLKEYRLSFIYSFLYSLERIFSQLENYHMFHMNMTKEYLLIQGKCLKLHNLIGCIYLKGQHELGKQQIPPRQLNLLKKLCENTQNIINTLFKSGHNNILKLLFPHISSEEEQQLKSIIKQKDRTRFLTFLHAIKAQYNKRSYTNFLYTSANDLTDLTQFIKDNRNKLQVYLSKKDLKHRQIIEEWIAHLCKSKDI